MFWNKEKPLLSASWCFCYYWNVLTCELVTSPCIVHNAFINKYCGEDRRLREWQRRGWNLLLCVSQRGNCHVFKVHWGNAYQSIRSIQSAGSTGEGPSCPALSNSESKSEQLFQEMGQAMQQITDGESLRWGHSRNSAIFYNVSGKQNGDKMWQKPFF